MKVMVGRDLLGGFVWKLFTLQKRLLRHCGLRSEVEDMVTVLLISLES